jgi:hypothetical protein
VSLRASTSPAAWESGDIGHHRSKSTSVGLERFRLRVRLGSQFSQKFSDRNVKFVRFDGFGFVPCRRLLPTVDLDEQVHLLGARRRRITIRGFETPPAPLTAVLDFHGPILRLNGGSPTRIDGLEDSLSRQ